MPHRRYRRSRFRRRRSRPGRPAATNAMVTAEPNNRPTAIRAHTVAVLRILPGAMVPGTVFSPYGIFSARTIGSSFEHAARGDPAHRDQREAARFFIEISLAPA